MTEAQDAAVKINAALAATDPARKADADPEVSVVLTKACKVCHKVKPLSEFYVTKTPLADGRMGRYHRYSCKACDNQRSKLNKRERKRAVGRVSADNRTGGKKSGNGAPAGAGGSAATNQYHFDTRFVRRLMRIARVLQRENWRDLDTLRTVDNQQLSAAGVQDGDVQILRKAQNQGDIRMLHFILHEPIAAPPPVHIVPATVVADPVGWDDLAAEVAEAPFAQAGAGATPGLTELLTREVLSDEDIEAAAHMLVQTRARLDALDTEIETTRQRLLTLHGERDRMEHDRSAAIDLLRRL